MGLEQFADIFQIVSVFVLIISVVYLALQVRTNTMIAKSQAHHAVTDSFNQINAIMLRDERAARIWTAGLQEYGGMSEEDRVAIGFMHLAYQRIFETLYYQHKNGTMPQELYEAEERTIRWAAQQPGFRTWWKENPISLSDEYRKFVARLIDEELAKETEGRA